LNIGDSCKSSLFSIKTPKLNTPEEFPFTNKSNPTNLNSSNYPFPVS
jgi:hypothetical protein